MYIYFLIVYNYCGRYLFIYFFHHRSKHTYFMITIRHKPNVVGEIQTNTHTQFVNNTRPRYLQCGYGSMFLTLQNIHIVPSSKAQTKITICK